MWRRLGLAFALIALAPAAAAEPKDVLRRLMAEPVTLFDWGLAQLDRDVARAAHRVFRGRIGVDPPETGSIYDWRANRVTMYVAVAAPPSQRTGTACTAAFRDIVDVLTEGAPAGPDAAGWYLLNAFRPKAHVWASRFEDVGKKLVAVVRLEVSLLPAAFEAVAGDARRVRCIGRLDADPGEIAVDVTS